MQQYPHIGIFGGSGSGKSFGLRVMLEELMKLFIPTIVFDPHYEMDFSERVEELKGRGPDFRDRWLSVHVGREVGVLFSALSTRDVIQLLGAAGNLTDSMTNVIETLHRKGDSYQSFSDRLSNVAMALEEGSKGLERRLRDPELTPEEAEKIRDLWACCRNTTACPWLRSGG